MSDHRNRYLLGFGDVYHCCANSSRWCNGKEAITVGKETVVDKDKVAQVVVAADVRRGRTILVDASLVCMVLLGLLYANLHADNYVEYNNVD